MKKKGQNVAKSKAKKPAAKKVVKKALAKKPAAKKPAAKKTAPIKATPKKVAPKKVAVKKPIPKKTAAPVKVAAPKVTKKADLGNVITPLDDRIVVQMTEAAKMTPGGLYIPDTVTDVAGNLQGTVVSVGRGHRNKKGQVRPMDLKVGDLVLFSQYAGSKIKIQDQDVLILRESDVLGVVG